MKKYLILAVVVVAIAVGAYYFFFAKNDVCRNVVPEDAKVVLVFDGKELVKQLDFSLRDIIDLIKHSDDDKEEVGIDFLAPMYGFVTSDNYLCAAFALSDAEDFEESISEQDVEVELQRGFKWFYKKDILLCFDSKKALLLGPVSKGESDGMRSKMVEWMNQGSHKIPMLSSIEDKDGILRMRTNLGVLPDTYSNQFEALCKNVDLKKVFFNVAFNLKEKALVLSSEMDSEDEAYTKLVSEWSGYNRSIEGKQLQTPYEKPLALAVFNLDGEALAKKLGENPTYGMILSQMNMFCNAGMMLQAIDGNVTIAIDNVAEGLPRFYVTAQVKNKDFMKDSKNWGSGLASFGVQCQQLESDNYMLGNNKDKIFFGVRDNLLYFASDSEVAKNGGKYNSLKDGTELKSLAKGKLSYISLDIDKLKDSSFAKSAIEGKGEVLKEILSLLDRLNIITGEDRAVEVELTTKQKISDIIKENVKK